MTTTLPPETRDEPKPAGPAPRRSLARRILPWAIGLAVMAIATGGLVLLSWMIDETHFDRPSEAFDELGAQVESVPGVTVDYLERWVEAPFFSDTTSWISLTVERASLPALLEAACSDYPDDLMWGINVRAEDGSITSLHADSVGASGGGPAACPEFTVDAIPLADALARLVPGLSVQPSVWDNERFALVTLEEETGIAALLPLVAHAEEIRDAAGLGPDEPVEINSLTLGFVIPPGESQEYVELLTVLSESHGVTTLYADGGGILPAGEEPQVQVTAPDREHQGIEAAIRASGVHFADFEVSFLPG